MKIAYRIRILILFSAFLFIIPVPVWAEDYDGNQIILSWTEDNAHSQTITWHSKSQKEGYVQFNESGGSLSENLQVKATITDVENKGYYRYEAVIKGLKSETVYNYRLGDGKRWSDIYNFSTAPAQRTDGGYKEEEEISILYMGDIQYQRRTRDYTEWGKLLQDARYRNPSIAFALIGGDMVNSSRKMKDWNLFLNNATSVFSYIPMMTTIGNHETSIKADPYLQILALPENGPQGLEEEFYSFDYANCHIAVMNTCFLAENRKAAMGSDWERALREVNNWLEEDLSQSKAKWKIVLLHHPPYGMSSDGDPIYHSIRQEWEPILERGRVDLVLCGHQHIYMRTKEIGGITYVIGNSGKRRSACYNGENAPRYSEALDATNCNYQIIKAGKQRLSVTAYDDQGQIIDGWSKKEKRLWPLGAIAAGIIIMHVTGAGVLLCVWKQKKRKQRSNRSRTNS